MNPAPDPAPGAPLAWRAWWLPWLARHLPLRLAAAALLLAAALYALTAWLHPLAGASLLVVLVLSLDQAIFPVSYRVDGAGVRLSTPLRARRHAWGEFTTVVPTPAGVLLRSPIRRAVHLLAPGREAEVLAWARDRITGAGG
jgi:hypothetical protein